MNADKRSLLSTTVATVALSATCAFAQGYDDPPEYRERSDSREAYRRGYERGFERGYAKGLAEGERRAPPPPPVAVPPPPPRLGPIRITGAFYGTSSKNCDATRYVASRANGKRNYSFEVSNNICGDPARGERKSLEVTYYCGQVVKSASANEHRTIYLDCTS
jgi:hypothetical protein